MRETHNKHRDGANAVHAASQSSESTSLWRCAPYVSHYGELTPSPFIVYHILAHQMFAYVPCGCFLQ